MHFWGLFAIIITAVGANLGYCLDSGLVIARAYPGRFDVAKTSHITRLKTVSYIPEDRASMEKMDLTKFYYMVASRRGELIKRDWVRIEQRHVDRTSRHPYHVTIQVSELHLDPGTEYVIGYQVHDDLNPTISNPFRVPTTDNSQPSSCSSVDDSSSIISTSMAIPARPSPVQSTESTTTTDIFASESSMSSTLTDTFVSESSLSSAPTDTSLSESSSSSEQTPISTVDQASTTSPASSTPNVGSSDASGGSGNTGSATPGIAHDPSRWFWSLLLFPIFWVF